MRVSRIFLAVFLFLVTCWHANAAKSIFELLIIKVRGQDHFIEVESLGDKELVTTDILSTTRYLGSYWYLGRLVGKDHEPHVYYGSFPAPSDPIYTFETFSHLRPGELITTWRHTKGRDSLLFRQFFRLRLPEQEIPDQVSSSIDVMRPAEAEEVVNVDVLPKRLQTLYDFLNGLSVPSGVARRI